MRLDEAMEYAQHAARHRRFPRAPAVPPGSEVDVVGFAYFGEPVVLLTRVHDDPVAAAYASLRVLHQALVWYAASERDPYGLEAALDAISENAFAKDPLLRTLFRLPGLGLRPIIAFDAAPELVTVRRTFALLHELAPLDPRGIVRATELWAWPAGGEPFRIAERMSRAGAKKRCPRCGSPYVVRTLYGLPGPEVEASAHRGEIALGGCFALGDEPDWICRACGAEWLCHVSPAAPPTSTRTQRTRLV